MTNLEKYREEIVRTYDGADKLGCAIYNVINGNIGCDGHCTDCVRKSLEWLSQECKEPILTDKEREYLKAVIKPFKEKIEYITKFKHGGGEYISIYTVEGYGVDFPDFENGKYYKNMELDKSYTLEELGL